MTSSTVIADIKSRLPVAEVVGETVALKRAGSAMKGLCPFHAEKTPSFTVSPDRESWHCFGCGEHGDIFTFVMKRDGLDFRETLGRLAERAGVELTPQTAREDRQRARLREALDSAAAWYREVLRQATAAEPARAYLVERGFSDETLERFGIGFAPQSWDALTSRLQAKKFTTEEIVGAGLASVGQRGRPVDRFRGRIMIPIRDPSGRMTGFGGRVMPGGDGPKYLNSPATPLFDKSHTLYGIDLARTSIRRTKLAVIVEGYTDVMAAHQAGFTNVVASLGTALTGGQVALATRYAEGVALAYDVDLAGEAATQRGLLEELGPDQSVSKVRVVRIPAGKDPDELIRSDPDAWQAAVEGAKPVVEYFMDRVAAEVDLSSVTGRKELAGRVLAILQRVGDHLERDLYLQELSRRVQVDERTLREALRRPAVVRRSTSTDVAITVGPRPDAIEIETLALILRHPDLLEALGSEPLPLSSPATALVAAWRDALPAEGRPDLAAFLSTTDPLLADLARDVLATPDAGGPSLGPVEAASTLRTCLLRLRVADIDQSIRDGRHLLDQAQRDDDRALLQQVEEQISRLGREKAGLTSELATPDGVLASSGQRRN
jgi:DNA primase